VGGCDTTCVSLLRSRHSRDFYSLCQPACTRFLSNFFHSWQPPEVGSPSTRGGGVFMFYLFCIFGTGFAGGGASIVDQHTNTYQQILQLVFPKYSILFRNICTFSSWFANHYHLIWYSFALIMHRYSYFSIFKLPLCITSRILFSRRLSQLDQQWRCLSINLLTSLSFNLLLLYPKLVSFQNLLL